MLQPCQMLMCFTKGSFEVASYQKYTDTITENCTEATLPTEWNSGKPKCLQNRLVTRCLPQRIPRTVIKVSWSETAVGDYGRDVCTCGPCCGLESQ